MSRFTRNRRLNDESLVSDILLTLLEKKKKSDMTKIVSMIMGEIATGGRSSSIVKQVEKSLAGPTQSVRGDLADEVSSEAPHLMVNDRGFLPMAVKVASRALIFDVEDSPMMYKNFMDQKAQDLMDSFVVGRGKDKFKNLIDRAGSEGKENVMNISEELLKIARDLEASPKSVKAGVPFDLSLATKGGARLTSVIGLEFAQGQPLDSDYALEKDGWFRRVYGPGKGYGLMIRNMTAGTKPVKTTEFFNVYRSTVTYLPDAHYNDDHPDNYEKEKMYVWVHRNYDISDVLGYVRSNLTKFVA